VPCLSVIATPPGPWKIPLLVANARRDKIRRELGGRYGYKPLSSAMATRRWGGRPPCLHYERRTGPSSEALECGMGRLFFAYEPWSQLREARLGESPGAGGGAGWRR